MGVIEQPRYHVRVVCAPARCAPRDRDEQHSHVRKDVMGVTSAFCHRAVRNAHGFVQELESKQPDRVDDFTDNRRG